MESGGFTVVAVLPAIAGGVPLLFVMSASRRHNDGYTATSDLGTAVARKNIKIKMSHCALYLLDVTTGASVHHHVDVFVFRSEPLSTVILESWVGDRLAHRLEFRVRERFFYKAKTQGILRNSYCS